MNQMVFGIVARKSTYPARGERVARFVEEYLRRNGVTLSELAHKADVDKRDLQRLLANKTCGSRLEDALVEYLGKPMIQAVMGPVVGEGPCVRDRDLANELAERLLSGAPLMRTADGCPVESIGGWLHAA